MIYEYDEIESGGPGNPAKDPNPDLPIPGTEPDPYPVTDPPPEPDTEPIRDPQPGPHVPEPIPGTPPDVIF